MALGRGLDSLIEDSVNIDLKNDQLIQLDLDLIKPDPNQPRKIFDEIKLEELGKSIKNYGILEPIIVKKQDDYYLIIAGERRWRAAKKIGLKEIPAIIKEESDATIELSIIENLQREDLNIVDLAQGYEFLINEFNYTHQELADKLGVTRSSITNILRILNLSEKILDMLRDTSLSYGKARTLLATKDEKVQEKLAEKIKGKNISVRTAESIVKRELNKSKKPQTEDSNLIFTDKVADWLSKKFDTKVALKINQDKGSLKINFNSKEQLQSILKLMGYSDEII